MSELADQELFLAGEDALTAFVPISIRALSGDHAPTCLAVWLPTVSNLGANCSALVLEAKKGSRFHPVKPIRHSRATGVSFRASNSAADEVTHVHVRSHLPGLYLLCVYLLICPKPVQDSIQILPNSGWVFPFGPEPESTDVQAHPPWTPHELQRIRRQSLSPRDRIVPWNGDPGAASGHRAHVQRRDIVGLQAPPWCEWVSLPGRAALDLQSCNSTADSTQGLPVRVSRTLIRRV